MLTWAPAGKTVAAQKLFQWCGISLAGGLPHLATFLSSTDFQNTQKPQKLLCRGWDNKQTWIPLPFYDPAPTATTISGGCPLKTEKSASVSFLFLELNKAC